MKEAFISKWSRGVKNDGDVLFDDANLWNLLIDITSNKTTPEYKFARYQDAVNKITSRIDNIRKFIPLSYNNREKHQWYNKLINYQNKLNIFHIAMSQIDSLEQVNANPVSLSDLDKPFDPSSP